MLNSQHFVWTVTNGVSWIFNNVGIVNLPRFFDRKEGGAKILLRRDCLCYRVPWMPPVFASGYCVALVWPSQRLYLPRYVQSEAENWHFHQEFCLLEYKALQYVESQPRTFRMNILPPSSGPKNKSRKSKQVLCLSTDFTLVSLFYLFFALKMEATYSS